MTTPQDCGRGLCDGTFIRLGVESDPTAALAQQLRTTLTLIWSISESQATFRYSPKEWSIAQVLRHVVDTERVLGLWAFLVARAGGGALPSIEHEELMHSAPKNDEISFIALEFENLRRGHILLFERLAPEAWLGTGLASGNRVSVHDFAATLVGHVRHHEAILRERYL